MSSSDDRRVLAPRLRRAECRARRRCWYGRFARRSARSRPRTDVARALDVGRVHRRRIDHPQPIVGGDVIDLVASVASRARPNRHRAGRRATISHRQPVERAQIGTLARQRAHAISAREQRAHHVASHEAVGARHECHLVAIRLVRHRDRRPAATMAAAAARPEITALSIVAGSPV